MARANRHYLPDRVWHLTHRCDQSAFPYRFIKDMLRAAIFLLAAGLTACAMATPPPSRFISTDEYERELLLLAVDCGRIGQPADTREMPSVTEIKEGRWMHRDEDGLPYIKGQCLDGRAEGEWVIIHPNGKRAVDAHFSHGRAQGTWLFWHYYGRKIREESFVDGVKDGPFRYWDKMTGHLSIEGQYMKGHKDGIWRSWNDDGLEVKENWVNGVRQTSEPSSDRNEKN
jgi:hypothetical protein